MKKILCVIAMFITFIIIYFLHSNFFNWFTIAGISPNLFAILALFIGLFMGRAYGIGVGLVLGLVLDLLIARVIGINSIAMAIIGILGGSLNERLSKDSKMPIILMVAGTTLAYAILVYSLKIFTLDMQIEIMAFLRIALIEVFFNIMILIIIYPIFKMAGTVVQSIFIKRKILMREF